MGFVALLLTTAAAAWAQPGGMADPTRPPPNWIPKDPREAADPRKGGAEEQANVPVSILLVGQTRRFALVRGELVGDGKAGARIVDIKRNDVVVQSNRGRETLNLFPDVQKTPPRQRAGMGNKD